jgi:hypothetical protein
MIRLIFIPIFLTYSAAFAQHTSLLQSNYVPINTQNQTPPYIQKYLQFGDEKKTIQIGEFYMNQIKK